MTLTLNLHVPIMVQSCTILFATQTIHNKGGDVPKAPFSFT